MKAEPLSFNRRLLWSLELFWRNLLSLIGLSLLAVGSVLAVISLSVALGFSELMVLLMPVSTSAGMDSPVDAMAMVETIFSPMMLIGLLLVLLISGILMFWYQAALYQIPVDSLITGERARIRTALKKSFIRLPDFMTTTGLVMIIVLIAQVATGLFAAAIGDSTLGILLGIISVVLIIWLTISFIMAGPIAVLEGHDPLGTLARTWHLAQGMRWRMLGHYFLLGLMMVVALLLGWLPLWLGAMVGGVVAAALGFVSLVLWLVIYLGAIFVGLFFAVSFYYEVRAIKGHWKAGWGDVPDESWPLSDIPDDVEATIRGRGLRSWLEFSALSIILMGLMYLSSQLLPSPSSMSMMNHSSQMGSISSSNTMGMMHRPLNP
ncbi:MAG: hypothetical protein OQK78_02105, partial [Gammaproteobacteria bacterium]|nr:hypothetical protein [Gammaproteobacteria bacterium]